MELSRPVPKDFSTYFYLAFFCQLRAKFQLLVENFQSFLTTKPTERKLQLLVGNFQSFLPKVKRFFQFV